VGRNVGEFVGNIIGALVAKATGVGVGGTTKENAKGIKLNRNRKVLIYTKLILYLNSFYELISLVIL